ncbi:TFIIH basal transcription factor complex helicase repD subunit [Pelomyxa schiedti]|nr:TFIIH basal transcription factor complex helicase repD subunit [Pelomyxa schiedti]
MASQQQPQSYKQPRTAAQTVSTSNLQLCLQYPYPLPQKTHVVNYPMGGGVYTGTLLAGQRHGQGKFSWPEIDPATGLLETHAYDGEWSNNVRQGKGTYTYPWGETEEGQWWFGRTTGPRVNRYQDGSVYEGDTCWGVMRYAEGGWYEGQWEGERWKRGAWHDPNGVDVHEGQWEYCEEGEWYCMQGWGVHRQKVGAGMVTVYEGEWDGDMMHGRGTWRSPDTGAVYCGEFDHDKMCGNGALFDGKGGSYVGQWLDGKFHGNGVLLEPDGSRYTGQFERGEAHGTGEKWGKRGSSFEGVWNRGAPLKGTARWPNGDEFAGTFTSIKGEGSGVAQLSGEGTLNITSGSLKGLKGTLHNDTFQSTDGAVLHKMGFSVPQPVLEQQIMILQKELEEVSNFLPQVNNSKTWTELSNAFALSKQLAFQVKKATPELVSLEEKLAKMKECIDSTTSHNKALVMQLSELTKLKVSLENGIEESERACKVILGQTLTEHNTEAEIQQCSRNLTLLTKRFLQAKPPLPENLPTGHPDEPMASKLLPPPQAPPSTSPPLGLCSTLTDTLVQLQGCRLEECTQLAHHHTDLANELSELSTQSTHIQQQVEELQEVCQKLNIKNKHKQMVRRSLEGDDQFVGCPGVLSELSELLPQAQQSITDVLVAKSTTASSASSSVQINNISQQVCDQNKTATETPIRAVMDDGSNQGGMCIECDERPRNICLHPCGHTVLCSDCATFVRKCPYCRSPIQHKQSL